MSELTNITKRAIVQTYVSLRHPESVALRRRGVNYEHYRELNKPWLKQLDLKTIVDVGANVGQFAKLARAVFPDAFIYSFEPLPDCFAQLVGALPGDTRFIPTQSGIGSKAGQLNFFRSFHSPSSSFLKMKDLHKEAFPYTSEGQDETPITVDVLTLDDALADNSIEKPLLVKIDVQGYELEVIAGASATLARGSVAVLEMSFAELYADQPLFDDVYRKMYSLGYRFKGSLSQMSHPQTGEVVQMDAIFVRQ